jgi:hypothetical protein
MENVAADFCTKPSLANDIRSLTDPATNGGGTQAFSDNGFVVIRFSSVVLIRLLLFCPVVTVGIFEIAGDL